MKVSLIFPGQGSQKVGMAKDFFESYFCARELFEMASDHLKINFKKLLFESTIEELSCTRNAQLAIFLASLTQYRVLRKEFCDLQIEVCAGLSLGEYTALVASEKMQLYDCLTLVENRARLMQIACQETSGAMRAVIGLSEDEVLECTNLIANINHPTQIVISGSKSQLDAAQEKLLQKGAKKIVPLKVSGAFHSSLMKSAFDHMQPLIDEVLIQSSQCQLIMNISGDVVEDPLLIKESLKNQIVGIVRWVDCMKTLEKITHATPIIEVGVGKVLSGMNRKMGVANTHSFEKVEDLKIIEKLLKGDKCVVAG